MDETKVGVMAASLVDDWALWKVVVLVVWKADQWGDLLAVDLVASLVLCLVDQMVAWRKIGEVRDKVRGDIYNQW